MILVTHFLFFVPIGPFSYVLSHIYSKISMRLQQCIHFARSQLEK